MEFASDIAFSESVKRFQRERGSRNSYARMEKQRGGFADVITPDVAAYIAERDSAYLATASAAGQPYVQHRGGPAGFIKVLDVLDPKTLAFADFVGNRQYITVGNLAENDRAFLFLMNYAESERIKIWGRANVVLDDAQLFEDPYYNARVEQAIVFRVIAWDVSCPQHIPRLIHAERVERAFERLQRRVRYLEATLSGAGIAFTPQEEPSLDRPIEAGETLTTHLVPARLD